MLMWQTTQHMVLACLCGHKPLDSHIFTFRYPSNILQIIGQSLRWRQCTVGTDLFGSSMGFAGSDMSMKPDHHSLTWHSLNAIVSHPSNSYAHIYTCVLFKNCPRLLASKVVWPCFDINIAAGDSETQAQGSLIILGLSRWCSLDSRHCMVLAVAAIPTPVGVLQWDRGLIQMEFRG